MREPALTAAGSIAIGIVVDRYLEVALDFWVWLAVGCLILWSVVRRRALLLSDNSRAAALLVALLLVAIGGARHHLFWSSRPENSISSVSGDSQPVRLRAVVSTPVVTKNNNRPGVPVWMRLDHSVFDVECQTLSTVGQPPLGVHGLVRVDVAGHLPDLQPLDQIEILGQLVVPQPPRNPGDFDYPVFLRSRGIDRVVRCDHPDAVRIIERPGGIRPRLARLRVAVRRECDQLLIENLPRRLQPVAASLLTGDRSDLREETEDAFIQSGTMHILAISGLHIGVLAGFSFWMCRLIRLRSLMTLVVTLAVIYGYAAIAESRPPVMRAVVLATLVVFGQVNGRQSNGIQALSLAALIMLLVNPTDLFDVGAQLSFVAVATIIVVTPWIAKRTRESFTDRLLAGERSGLMRAVSWIGRWLLAGYSVTIAVWVVTVPITMRTFHLVSPAGLVVNALLTPFSTIVLCAGYVFLGVGLLCPALAGWVVIPFRESLHLFLNAIEWSARLPGGFGESPSPSLGWMVGFYLMLVAGLLWKRPEIRRWIWRGILVWTLAWLAVGALPRTTEPGLVCTFQDVGHGEAILVVCPNGRTLLYDIGSMGDGRRAARAVQAQLRERGVGRIDALVLSHADADHYNGGIDLVSRTPMGTALFSQHCLDFEQEGIPELFDELAQHGSTLRMVQSGDRVLLDPSVQIEVLHPSSSRIDTNDNGNSIVLKIVYAGRSILLTGDIEKAGAAEIQQHSVAPVDLLLAPHHGGKSANTTAFAEWSRPSHVVVSSRTDVSLAMRQVYHQAKTVHCTASSGAIRVMIRTDGALSIDTYNR